MADRVRNFVLRISAEGTAEASAQLANFKSQEDSAVASQEKFVHSGARAGSEAKLLSRAASMAAGAFGESSSAALRCVASVTRLSGGFDLARTALMGVGVGLGILAGKVVDYISGPGKALKESFDATVKSADRLIESTKAAQLESLRKIAGLTSSQIALANIRREFAMATSELARFEAIDKQEAAFREQYGMTAINTTSKETKTLREKVAALSDLIAEESRIGPAVQAHEEREKALTSAIRSGNEALQQRIKDHVELTAAQRKNIPTGWEGLDKSLDLGGAAKTEAMATLMGNVGWQVDTLNAMDNVRESLHNNEMRRIADTERAEDQQARNQLLRSEQRIAQMHRERFKQEAVTKATGFLVDTVYGAIGKGADAFRLFMSDQLMSLSRWCAVQALRFAAEALGFIALGEGWTSSQCAAAAAGFGAAAVAAGAASVTMSSGSSGGTSEGSSPSAGRSLVRESASETAEQRQTVIYIYGHAYFGKDSERELYKTVTSYGESQAPGSVRTRI